MGSKCNVPKISLDEFLLETDEISPPVKNVLEGYEGLFLDKIEPLVNMAELFPNIYPKNQKKKCTTNFTLMFPLLKEALIQCGYRSLNRFIYNQNFANSLNSTYVSENRDYIGDSFVKEINILRNDITEYTKKIEKYGKLINTDKVTNKKYFKILSSLEQKIYLPTGNTPYIKSVSVLKEFHKKLKEDNIVLQPLIRVEELQLPFPEDLNQTFKIESIKERIWAMRERVCSRYNILHFHFDIIFDDAEFSTVMKIAYDSVSLNSMPEGLLKSNIKYIGVNSLRVLEMYIVYIIYATDEEPSPSYNN